MGALPADSKPSRASPGRGEARADIAEILDHLPKAPGVYLIKDGEGKILYIGKAKSLRSRVHAYFRPFAHDGRPQLEALLKHARDLETIVTDTELEALILEANLIKAHKPKYNINLKDDKKYPFVRITKEPFPPNHRDAESGSGWVSLPGPLLRCQVAAENDGYDASPLPGSKLRFRAPVEPRSPLSGLRDRPM